VRASRLYTCGLPKFAKARRIVSGENRFWLADVCRSVTRLLLFLSINIRPGRFRGAFGPHEGIVLEETGDSVILKVEKNDTLGNLGQVAIWKTSLRPL
jgi:hypothetical protein